MRMYIVCVIRKVNGMIKLLVRENVRTGLIQQIQSIFFSFTWLLELAVILEYMSYPIDQLLDV